MKNNNEVILDKNKTKKEKKQISMDFVIVAIILIAIFSIALTPVTLQNDTYYSIKIGEHIVNNGIDMKDPFSWHENLNYTYPHWLYDVITYFIYSIFGFKGIFIATCALSATLGISIFIINHKLNNNAIMSFIITILVMYVMESYIAARAQLVTFILFIWTIYYIEKFLKTKNFRYSIPLIIIPILIANLHVAVFPFYFILYLPYIAEYLIAILSDIILNKKDLELLLKIKIARATKAKKPNKEKIDKLKAKLEKLHTKVEKIKIKRSKEKNNPYKLTITRNPNVKWLIIIMIICILTGFLTPLGTTPYTYLYKTMQGNTTQNINEHLPMTLANNMDALISIALFLAILIFTKVKIRLSDFFMICGLCYLMLKTRRQLSIFVLISCLILNRLIINLIIEKYSKDGIKKLEKAFENIGVTVALTIFMCLLSFYFIKPKLDDKFVSETSYPVQACDYILENIDLTNAKFYNEYNYGSYMLFRGIPVFIDSRADLYAPEFSGLDDDIFYDFIQVSNSNMYYGDAFDKYKITHVICGKNSKTNLLIVKTKDENYKELYSDDHFVVYERVQQ